jgi:hypothetical protein
MKKISGFIFGIFSLLAYAQYALAISLCPVNSFGANLCTLDVGTAIGKFISFVYVVAVVAALFYLVWGGFKWLTSGGDKAAVQSAREHIVAALVGLVIIFLSYLILSFVAKFFLGSSFNLQNITIPSL